MILFLLSGSVFPLYSQADPTSVDSTKLDIQTWKPSPSGAAFRSAIIPGWGQAYNERPMKAAIYAGIQQILLISIYDRDRNFRLERRKGNERKSDVYLDNRNRMIWYYAGIMLVSVLDAYVDAHLYDFDVSDNLTMGELDLPGNRSGGSVGIKISYTWRMK